MYITVFFHSLLFRAQNSKHKHILELLSSAQDSLKRRLVTEDDFRWQLPATAAAATTAIGGGGGGVLKYVGGVDISFAKDDPSMACGTLVVLDVQTLQVVYEDYSLVTLHVPYVPGFLAFREVINS